MCSELLKNEVHEVAILAILGSTFRRFLVQKCDRFLVSKSAPHLCFLIVSSFNDVEGVAEKWACFWGGWGSKQ